MSESRLGSAMLKNTPILSGLVDNTVEVYSEVWGVIRNREDKSNREINTLVLATLLDNQLITIDSAKNLVESNKIIIADDSLLDQYQDNGTFYDMVKERYYGE